MAGIICQALSPGECYFPLLYYTCASAYHECKEDENTTIRIEQQVFSPPPVSGEATGGAAADEFVVVLEPLIVPRYPCGSFCRDPQVQQCKDKLITAVNESLAGRACQRFFVSTTFIEPQGTHMLSINQPPPPFQADRAW